jgi:homospermidine synthase
MDVIDVPASNITVIDMEESRKSNISSALAKGVVFIAQQITIENRAEILSTYCKKGDFLLDLAWEIDTMQQLEWCRENGVLYLNTSLEVWNPVGSSFDNPDPRERTLYSRHQELREMVASWPKNPDNPDVTALYEHGANPGIVSYLVLQALSDLTNKLLEDPQIDSNRKIQLKQALDSENYAKLCQLTGTKVIHISERDTQISSDPKKPGEFCNTWSIEGYYEEGLQPVEMCWGTHEKYLPKGTYKYQIPTDKPKVFNYNKDGTGHSICLSQPG